jgi:hypothetical protein
MNVEIGAEAALFPEKEYKYGIFIAVRKNFGVPEFRESLQKISSHFRENEKLALSIQP